MNVVGSLARGGLLAGRDWFPGLLMASGRVWGLLHRYEQGGVDSPDSRRIVVVPGRKYYAVISLGACSGFLGRVNGIATRIINEDTGEVVDESPVWDPQRDEPTASLAFAELSKPGRYVPQVVAFADPGDTSICLQSTYLPSGFDV